MESLNLAQGSKMLKRNINVVRRKKPKRKWISLRGKTIGDFPTVYNEH